PGSATGCPRRRRARSWRSSVAMPPADEARPDEIGVMSMVDGKMKSRGGRLKSAGSVTSRQRRESEGRVRAGSPTRGHPNRGASHMGFGDAGVDESRYAGGASGVDSMGSLGRGAVAPARRLPGG